MDWQPPDACGNGHPQRYPNVTVSWTPCECTRAVPQPPGHTQQRCNICGWLFRENGCDKLVDGKIKE